MTRPLFGGQPMSRLHREPRRDQVDEVRERARSTQRVFAGEEARHWLQERAGELTAPTYQPGMTIDQVAFAEGRKSFLREIYAEIYAASMPDPSPETEKTP